MENYLFDRETLGQFIDELMNKRTIPVESADELGNFRESQIKALDDRITNRLFGRLTESQITQLNQLLSNDEQDPDVFQKFFEDCNIDVNNVVSESVQSFSSEFLTGGQQNA